MKKECIMMIIFFAVIWAFFTCIVKNTFIVSGSMEPTLMTDECALFNRLAYILRDAERGDIVSYWSNEHQEVYVKRVIGIEGDKIEFYDGNVYINGVVVDERDYLVSDMKTYCVKEFEVPEGTVFVLGDNRMFSYDSRLFQQPYIPIDNIYGKYICSYPNIYSWFRIDKSYES